MATGIALGDSSWLPFGYIVILPPNAEQAANGAIGIVCVKAGDNEVIGSYAFCEGDERDFANLQRFKRILKRHIVQDDDGTGGIYSLIPSIPRTGSRPGTS